MSEFAVELCCSNEVRRRQREAEERIDAMTRVGMRGLKSLGAAEVDWRL